MLGKEKLLDKQKRLVEQRDQLKDKIKYIGDTIKKSPISSNTSFTKKESSLKSLNPKKPLPSVISHNSGNNSTPDTKTEVQQKSTNEALTPSPSKTSETKSTASRKPSYGTVSPSKPQTKLSTDSNTNEPTASSESHLSSSQKSTISLSKYQKLGSIESNTISSSTTPKKIKKPIKRKLKKSESKVGNKYFPAGFMVDYCKQIGDTPFSLPLKEFSELMLMKQQIDKQIKKSSIALDATLKQFSDIESPPEHNSKMKCFSQTSQSVETNPSDGVITNCYMNNTYLIIVQTNKINAYCKDDSSKGWVLKDSMVRLRIENSIKEVVVPCVINKRETLVFCEMYLVKDQRTQKCYLKMAQYRFFSEQGKIMKDFLLGTFDCQLEKFVCCNLIRRSCTLAVSAWAKQQARGIAWIFIHTVSTDTMKCTPMIPVKHEVVSLHDISVASNKTLLLGFGTKSFTVWNGKSGERFIFVNLSKLGPVKTMRCFYTVFAIIQKGFLFLVVGVKDKLHMVAINMATGIFRSLRQFKLPKDHTCLEVVVNDDKLIGVTDKSIICWSLYNAFKLQQLRMEEGDKAYIMRRKLLITSANTLKRTLIVKVADDVEKRFKDVIRSDASLKEKFIEEVTYEANESEETSVKADDNPETGS